MGSRLGRRRSLQTEDEPRGAAKEAGAHLRLASRLLRAQKLPRALRRSSPAPYERRVGWIREIQATLREHQRERASRLLRLLRQDLGLEGTFLNEVLYEKAAFLSLVDPISHDLLMSLARDLQCPKKEYDPWKSSDRICRQLIYHLTPHPKWHRHGAACRKSQASLKRSLRKERGRDALDLSGVSLSARDLPRLAHHLQGSRGQLRTVDLSFTGLTDELLRRLLPSLWTLPGLTRLSLSGNCLTRASAKELTEAVKDPAKFPFLAWVDLGNNVDVSSMPQPLLLGLRSRLGLQTALPPIPESSPGREDLPAGGPPAAAAGAFPRQSCGR